MQPDLSEVFKELKSINKKLCCLQNRIYDLEHPSLEASFKSGNSFANIEPKIPCILQDNQLEIQEEQKEKEEYILENKNSNELKLDFKNQNLSLYTILKTYFKNKFSKV